MLCIVGACLFMYATSNHKELVALETEINADEFGIELTDDTAVVEDDEGLSNEPVSRTPRGSVIARTRAGQAMPAPGQLPPPRASVSF